jgi:hypothetical protein
MLLVKEVYCTPSQRIGLWLIFPIAFQKPEDETFLQDMLEVSLKNIPENIDWER